MNAGGLSEQDVGQTYEALKKDAEEGGYRINPDKEFAKNLVRGLLKNNVRYGYGACPCRLASGKRAEDLDIVCPCDYRDSDIEEFGACYCALYVNDAIAEGVAKVTPVPERRPPRLERGKGKEVSGRQYGSLVIGGLPYPVWRCKVCGYLCAREQPPGICPVCKAQKDRFERFI